MKLFAHGHLPLSSISGVWGAEPLLFVGKTQYQILADFRQSHLSSAGDRNTVFQNDRFDNLENGPRFFGGNGALAWESTRGIWGFGFALVGGLALLGSFFLCDCGG